MTEPVAAAPAGTVFDAHLRAWDLRPDGAPVATPSSHLLPVRTASRLPAMLKLAHAEEERFGGLLMSWWDGDGAARVLRRDDDALLLERATGTRSLAAMARAGGPQDDEATRIICRAVARLHAPRRTTPPRLVPLTHWFRALPPFAARAGGLLARADAVARELLADPRDVVPLHGDVHHDNVLDFGPRGWLAIDPKRLLGDRGFDYANIVANPDREVALRPGRYARQAAVAIEMSGLDAQRFHAWVLAYSALSAVWWREDHGTGEVDLAVAELAEAALREL